MNILEIIGRDNALFENDIAQHDMALRALVRRARFLVIGGAGTIGQAVTREIFRRNPKVLHVVDISENNMVELVRDIRSTLGYNDADFRTFAIDCGGCEFRALMSASEGYDYVLNLSALKHVRSEKDPFTLMRLIEVNILNTIATLHAAKGAGARKYFSVSTDKAANPVNLMGASKRIMEMFLIQASETLPVSTARFANVAFSDGSLLHGFNQRFAKRQPIAAPQDVQRYFLTPQEAGELCLLSCMLGENRDIFFPKICATLNLIRFSDIAERYLHAQGYAPHRCRSEDEARERAAELIPQGRWPVYFFESDTTGEKDFEQFFTSAEMLDLGRFDSVGVIRNAAECDPARLAYFLSEIERIRSQVPWSKAEIVALFNSILPDFNHKETGKYLDSRM